MSRKCRSSLANIAALSRSARPTISGRYNWSLALATCLIFSLLFLNSRLLLETAKGLSESFTAGFSKSDTYAICCWKER